MTPEPAHLAELRRLVAAPVVAELTPYDLEKISDAAAVSAAPAGHFSYGDFAYKRAKGAAVVEALARVGLAVMRVPPAMVAAAVESVGA